jgi:hypothetical protein
MKKLFLLPICIMLLMVGSSYKTEQIADPEIFAAKVWSFLQKKDSVGFVNFLKLTKEDVLYISTTINNNTFITESKKTETLKFINDTSFFTKINGQISITYNKVQKYFIENNLDISKANIAYIEFEIEKEDDLPFIILEDLDLFIKLDENNYKIGFDDIIQIKGIYKGVRGGGVIKLNEKFNEVYDYSSEEYALDSTVATAVVDTAYVIEETTKVGSSVYDHSQMSPKQKKYYKKIEKLNKQTELLYQKIAEEDMVFEK